MRERQVRGHWVQTYNFSFIKVAQKQHCFHDLTDLSIEAVNLANITVNSVMDLKTNYHKNILNILKIKFEPRIKFYHNMCISIQVFKPKITCTCAGFSVAFGSTGCSGSAGGHAPFVPLEKTFFTLKKIIILCVNYRTLHVKQPDVTSGVRPETKPLRVDRISYKYSDK